MNILVVGGEASFRECQQKFGPKHKYARAKKDSRELSSIDIVFDFNALTPAEVARYEGYSGVLFLNACKSSMAAICQGQVDVSEKRIFGFNGMPTLLNREILELSLLDSSMHTAAVEICRAVATDYRIVDDRLGLVSGRIIAMIINEAYYAVQEGIASRQDIDKAMRLGTNYPWGPFEWVAHLGLPAVYELIVALYDDTHDERYKVCPQLKKEYLRSKRSG